MYRTGRSDQAQRRSTPSSCSAPPSTTATRRRSSPLGSTTSSTLYEDGVAPLIVVTGGKQPSDRFTEAEASAQYLVDRGVPSEAIAMEGAGRTTYQSLAGAAELLDQRGLDRVVLVTDPYHALRSRLIAQDVGLTAYVSPTPTSVVRGGNSVRRHLAEAAAVALGRIIGFDHL